MATLSELEKDRKKSEADFDSAKAALEKALSTALAEKDAGKQVSKLKESVMQALKKAIKAGEDYEDADDKLTKAAKAYK